MASSNWLTVGSLVTPAVAKGDFLSGKRSAMVATKLKTAIVPLQVKCEKGHKSLTTKDFAVSRRDMMQCLTAQVLGLALLPKPAAAGVSRLEMKKMIMEKLQELREKVGLSKPKTENGKNSPAKPSPEDNKSPTKPSPEDNKSPTKPSPEDNKSPTKPSPDDKNSPKKPSPEDKNSPTLPLPPPDTVQTLVEATVGNIPPSNNAL